MKRLVFFLTTLFSLYIFLFGFASYIFPQALSLVSTVFAECRGFEDTCDACSGGLQNCIGQDDVTFESCSVSQSCDMPPDTDSCSCGPPGHRLISCTGQAQCIGQLGDGCGYCAYPTPTYITPYAYPTPTYPTPYAYPTPAYAYPTPSYPTPSYPTPYSSPYAYPTPYATPLTPYGTPYTTPYTTPVTCPGSCGDFNRGGLPSCSGGWEYTPSGNSGCTVNPNTYCYVCVAYSTPYAAPYATPIIETDCACGDANRGGLSACAGGWEWQQGSTACSSNNRRPYEYCCVYSYPSPPAPVYGSPYSSPYSYPTPAWWQSKDADVTSQGTLGASLPSGTFFSLEGPGGFPGIPLASRITIASDQISSRRWRAETSYTGRTYNYDWFTSLAPGEVFSDSKYAIADSQINGSALKNDAKARNGFVWHYRNGDLTINGNTSLQQYKIILFVNGSLTINNNIDLNDGEGFFLVVAKNGITLSSNVSHPNQPSLEGFYITDGQFKTGQGSSRLYVRGSVAALGGILMQRDLGGANSSTPAELYEYAPDLIFTFPSELLRTGIVWREVAP